MPGRPRPARYQDARSCKCVRPMGSGLSYIYQDTSRSYHTTSARRIKPYRILKDYERAAELIKPAAGRRALLIPMYAFEIRSRRRLGAGHARTLNILCIVLYARPMGSRGAARCYWRREGYRMPNVKCTPMYVHSRDVICRCPPGVDKGRPCRSFNE